MLINAHCHVFTFKTFLTGAAEENLKERLKTLHLSQAVADDALKIVKKILFGENAYERIKAFAIKHGLADSPILEFLRRGCLPSVSAVTDALLADTEKSVGPGEDAIVTPLMMDVITSEDSESDHKLYDAQYDQTVLQAVRHPGRVLPFVAVNPLRGPKAYTRMEEALTSGACVGVKLYPSLGYTVTDKMMDKVMVACAAYKAPVTMHCNDGGFCGPGYGYTYCSPVSWRDMIKAYDVRFNFAHFGDQTPGKPGSDTSWRDEIVKLMDDYPERVYADVSYQSGPLGAADEKTAYVGWLKNELASPRGNNILFGTDSFMLFLSAFESDYWQFFKYALGPDFRRMAETNPKRFLGLPAVGEAVTPDTAMARHIDFLKRKKAESGSGFGTGSAPAGWLAGRL
jgi:predicted TIM-barrel fold metal-dependent hydrolase